MKTIKNLFCSILLVTAFVACDKDENQDVVEQQTTQETPDIDPLISGGEKAPIDVELLAGTWQVTHRWTPDTGWQTTDGGTSIDFVYGSFLYSVDTWSFQGFSVQKTGDTASGNPLDFGTYRYNIEGSNEIEIFYDPTIVNMIYRIRPYRSGNALLIKSLYENALEPNEYFWWVRQ